MLATGPRALRAHHAGVKQEGLLLSPELLVGMVCRLKLISFFEKSFCFSPITARPWLFAVYLFISASSGHASWLWMHPWVCQAEMAAWAPLLFQSTRLDGAAGQAVLLSLPSAGHPPGQAEYQPQMGMAGSSSAPPQHQAKQSSTAKLEPLAVLFAELKMLRNH